MIFKENSKDRNKESIAESIHQIFSRLDLGIHTLISSEPLLFSDQVQRAEDLIKTIDLLYFFEYIVEKLRGLGFPQVELEYLLQSEVKFPTGQALIFFQVVRRVCLEIVPLIWSQKSILRVYRFEQGLFIIIRFGHVDHLDSLEQKSAYQAFSSWISNVPVEIDVSTSGDQIEYTLVFTIR